MTYSLVCMSFDGDYVIEGTFKTLEQAWERNENMGSRWVFYPFRFVSTESLRTVLDAYPPLEFLKGKKISDVKNLFRSVFESDFSYKSVDDFCVGLIVASLGRVEFEEGNVTLIASGYDWECPFCQEFVHEIEVTETVTCESCEKTFKVADHIHAYG